MKREIHYGEPYYRSSTSHVDGYRVHSGKLISTLAFRTLAGAIGKKRGVYFFIYRVALAMTMPRLQV